MDIAARRRLRDLAPRFLAELVVIVVGVLIALWFEGWRERQNDRVAQSRLLESLAAEMRTNIDELELNIRFTETRPLSALRAFLEIHEGLADLPEPDSALELMTWVTSYRRIRPQFSAYDAMISTGSAELLPSNEITQRLALHRVDLERGQGDEAIADRAFQSLVDRIIPHGGTLAYHPEWVTDRIGVAWIERPRDWASLVADRALMDAAYWRILTEDNILRFHREQVTELQQTLQLLEESLAIR